MHHLYPMAKGDPMCPLGFHPQVRWPTRCKRCFRDYKEHGGRKRDDDFTASTPSLSTWNSPTSRSRDEENGADGERTSRGWSSSVNLSYNEPAKKDSSSGSNKSTAWTSTPDLANESETATAVTVNLKLPKRRSTGPLPSLDTGQTNNESVTVRRPSASPPPTTAQITINKNDSLAERVRKMQLMKAQSSFEKESSLEKERERRSLSRSKEEEKPKAKEEKPKTKEEKPKTKEEKSTIKDDVNFMMQVKSSRSPARSKPPIRGGPTRDKEETSDDEHSLAGTTTTDTETTLIDGNAKEMQEQIESLKSEVDLLKKRCERVEKEKSDILLRRLANIDTVNKYSIGRSSEVLKLQQKVNDLTTQNEDLKDEKKHLSLRIKEVEAELESRPSVEAQTRQIEQLRAKLLAAETLCEELMDENEDMKKELRDLEEEIEEMQDTFREDQADEYSSLRRELEQTIKNCRVLSFKLKKTERRNEQLEQEKADQEKKLLEIVGGKDGMERENRIKELEQEVARSNEVSLRLQRDLAEANTKLAAATGAPPANLKKQPPTDGKKVSRSSLTRGGSQEDPAQLLRDLQDSLEREADLREQLRNAEEEANNLRKTASRVEDDNESLLLQLKKMATKARSRKLSPTAPNNRLSIEAPNEKDEGISDEEDPAELRLLLELNEQEAAVLRKKVEDLEQDKETLKKQVKDLTEKVSNAATKPNANTALRRITNKSGNLAEEKVKVLEDEIDELRKKLIEKERDCERLHAELSLAHKKPKGSLMKSKSLDGDQQNVDLKRQLQVIEQEASVLRTKTQSLEADNEKLQAENKRLQLLKGAKTLKTDKSLETSTLKVTQLEKELKEALTKIKELETNKDDKGEKKVRFSSEISKKEADSLKLKQEELDKLKLNYSKLEKEKTKLQTSLKELKDDAMKSFKARTPKKITDLTTKLQMKKMVEDLENEIGELYVVMKNAGLSSADVNMKAQMTKDIEDIKTKLSKKESEFTNEKNRLQTEIGKLKDLNTNIETENKSLQEKAKALESENNNTLSENKKLKEEIKKLESQIDNLNTNLKKTDSQSATLTECKKKIEELKKELENKDKEVEKLKKQAEALSSLEQDKNKLLKEVGDKTKKIGELEKKIKDTEDKYKRTEKLLASRKDRLSKLEKELSEEKGNVEALSDAKRRMSFELSSEKEEIQSKLFKSENKFKTLETDMKKLKADYESKITNLESTIAAKDIHIKQLEDALRDTSNQKYDEAISSVELAQIQEKYDSTAKQLQEKQEELASTKQELSKIEKELSASKNELSQLNSTINKAEMTKKELEEKLKAEQKETKYWESKTSEIETDLQAERKKLERMRTSHDKDTKNKEAELATLKGKLKILEQTSGAGAKRIAELKQEYEDTIKKLEHKIAMEKAEYEELTGKYELLEEEHVVTKARLTVEKEQAQGDLIHAQKELNTTLTELKTLQENYDTQSSAWLSEKATLQKEISSLQDRLCGGGWEVEKSRLNTKLEQREKELRDAIEKHEVLSHHHEIAKKELDEAKRKLEDYEKVSKVQRTLTADNAELERELNTLNTRLEQMEKARKNEISETKMRYEGQMNSMRDELKSLHNQVSRFKRERDNYKQMLESAQQTLTDMKNGNKTRPPRASISSTDDEEYRNKVATLEQQVACLEDELCEARLLSSKLNTELVSERSSAEVRLAEMQSRINEYEEDRLLSSGRARVSGLATRMELAWHKERDEQQRLLQETSTLARDLRQTLFELEREREKERLDMKRRIDQIKRTTEEETEEAKKKVSELQCDLLELRDAHAKLRTANEKLRRDKERHDRDRDQNKLLVGSLKRAQQEDDRVITQLLETIDDLIKQSPELFRNETPIKPEKSLATPTPPRRNRSSKSRSRSATPEHSTAELVPTGTRLLRLADELRASRIAERQRRQLTNARRAMSTEPRDTMTVSSTSRAPSRVPSLKKRSISLEQTTKDQSSIWKTVDDSSVSSMQSLDGDDRLYTMQRDTSLDSRLSGGSAQSEVLPSEKKKKKSLFGKLKKLTKSRSIDDHVDSEAVDFRPIGNVSQQGSDSDMSATGSKQNLRGRISDMFSRKGQLSRGNSKEQSPDTGSTSGSRSILRNASSSTLPRSATLNTTESQSSRAASTTPGTKRKGK
ncbi:early endosome antigen 1 isoform X2 [Colias croceus]|uniref:early endosome antigen 1 isoform X2 n=1 Tax=Colias crocea TaxID=72248 RepID=UPI001E27E60E|nr:early endosome antigen 1 isoform X2 [Colias croceus]